MTARRPASTYTVDGKDVGPKDAIEAVVEDNPGLTRPELVERLQAISSSPDDQVHQAVYYAVSYTADVHVRDRRVYPGRQR